MTPRGSAGKRLVALGYQGYGNLGDEAILTGIEALLGSTDLCVGWVVCGPSPEAVAAFPEARRIVSPRLLPTSRAARALRASDGLLLAGGGLINDHWPTIVPRFLAWIVLARLLGRRVVWLGVGVGPLRRRSQRVMARLARRLSALVLVRDDASAAALGGNGSGVSVVPDPAVFNPAPTSDAARTGTLVIVREPVRARDAERAALAERVVTTVDDLARTGRAPVVATMAGSADAAIVDAIRDVARRRGVTVAIEALGPRPFDVLDRLSRCDAVLSIRLHGILLAAVGGTPVVGVAYDGKVRGVASRLGMEDLVLDPAQLGTREVVAALDAAARPGRIDAVRSAVEAERAHAADVARRVAGAFGGPR